MIIEDLLNKQVAILGYGTEGRAVARYLLKKGITPTIFDKRPLEDFSSDIQDELAALGTTFILGSDYLEEFRNFDVAFRSPGLWRLTPRLIEEEKKGLAITSQSQWFFEHCPAKIIGVTGTKGKGTTSSLIYSILLKGWTHGNVYLTGNIHKTPPLDFLSDIKSDDIVVFELSSFQLQDMTRSPQVAVVLMITEDHLDAHRSVNEYRRAKENIVKHQTPDDFAVINIDYGASASFASKTPGHVYEVSLSKKIARGCFVDHGKFYARGFSGMDSDSNPVIVSSDLPLRGPHNWENAAAAISVAFILGVDQKVITQEVRSFTGLEHRLEFVAEKQGVKFYNDSLSTIQETAIAAMRAFSEPIVLILGGSEKHSNFSQLAEEIIQSDHIRALILVGQMAQKIKSALELAGGYTGPLYEGAGGMKEIIEQARAAARPGDVVVLSPACASFDMFQNHADRGNQFRQIVKALV